MCLAKGEPTFDFCKACLVELPILGCNCALCAGQIPVISEPGAICGRCLAQLPAFGRAFAAFPYAPPIDDLIRGLKFGQRLYCARVLGRLLALRAMSNNIPLPDCFVPVPLYRTRLCQRGFNQSLEIARAVSHCLKVPLNARCLKKTRASVPQTALPAKQRRHNLKGAFALACTLDCLLRAQFIVIVDDVMTTGTTLNEAARVLRKAGVPRVEVWTVARVISK